MGIALVQNIRKRCLRLKKRLGIKNVVFCGPEHRNQGILTNEVESIFWLLRIGKDSK